MSLLGLASFTSGYSFAGDPPAKAGASTLHSSDEVLLVANGNSPISMAIAEDYAAQRRIAKRVVIHCADSALSTENETISLADYSRQIAAPVGDYLDRHKEINFIVLTKGVPIRVEGGQTGSRSVYRNGNLNASVDSYLAAIDYPALRDAKKIGITGSGATGTGWLNRYWGASIPFTHAQFGGYLVTRLDGLTQAHAKALVSNALLAESSALPQGKVLLDVQRTFGIGEVASQPQTVTRTVFDEAPYDAWNADLVKTADLLLKRGFPVELDQTKTFAAGHSDLLGYFSWGSNDPTFSDAAYRSLQFSPGAIGETAVSTSARTFLPTTGGQSLISVLIQNGITGVKGYTDEPLMQAIASPSVLMDRYTAGFTLAESFYASSRFVGWTDIVVGDPLCRLPQIR